MPKLITLQSHQQAQALFGPHDANIRLIEKELKVKITARGDTIKLSGRTQNVKDAARLIGHILDFQKDPQHKISTQDIYYLLRSLKAQTGTAKENVGYDYTVTSHVSQTKPIGPKTKGQQEYVEAILSHDIVLGIGPAGTGKTYLAMACAVNDLKNQKVRRIILTRPAIEAGESLGFLPGDMQDKISPYLRPLYDALYDMMEADRIEKYLETGIIEVAPLAYMRGRTLNESFIILDEAQNCSAEQMKMFLTRLGFDSKAVITGDITQSDLPGGKPAGLLQARNLLGDIAGIKIIHFTGADVVRHPLVQKIIEAYDKSSNL